MFKPFNRTPGQWGNFSGALPAGSPISIKFPAKSKPAQDFALVKFSPPRDRPQNLIGESTFRGVKNNVPHEWVFKGQISVFLADTGVAIPQHMRTRAGEDCMLLMFDITADNGFQSRAVVPVSGYSNKEMDVLRKNLAKSSRRPTILYQSATSWIAVLERPIGIAEDRVLKSFFDETSSEATCSKMQYEDKHMLVRSFVSRQRPDGRFEAEPEILSGYPALSAYERLAGEGDKLSRGRAFLYLTPEVVNGFGRQGTLFNLPYVRYHDPHLAQMNFPTETVEVLGENGRPVQWSFNCYTNFKGAMFPLRKPSDDDFEREILKPIRALQSVPRAQWRAFIDGLILDRYVDSIETIDATAWADVKDESTRRERACVGQSERPTIGAVYDGPRDSIAFYRDQFVVFGLTLENDRKIYLVDSPRYGTALHVYSNAEMAKLHTQGIAARKISTTDQAHLRKFVHDPEGRWKEQLQDYLIDLQSGRLE
jgi:hypothetical protein